MLFSRLTAHFGQMGDMGGIFCHSLKHLVGKHTPTRFHKPSDTRFSFDIHLAIMGFFRIPANLSFVWTTVNQ